MNTKEKCIDLMINMIADMVMLGATQPMVKCLVQYSADVIDAYKNEEKAD